jgi:hypothetical protein
MLVCVCPILESALFERLSYTEALARWQAQGVQEYEIVVETIAFSSYAGIWTLHVTGTQIEVVDTPYYKDWMTHTGLTMDDLRSLTVAGQFETAARLANRGLSPQSQHSIVFDPTLGYPRALESHPWPWKNVTDADWRRTTKCLKIIKAQRSP